jgi:hypothetical protein
MYEHFATSAANDKLLPRLPAPMREPGYDLWADPRIEHHVQTLIDLVRSSDAGGAVSSRDVRGLSSPSLSLSFSLGEGATLPLLDTPYDVTIQRGTRLDIYGDFTGPVTSPNLSSLTIRFNQPIEVAPRGASETSLRKIEIRSITIEPGAQIRMDYVLAPEQMVDGAKALVALFVMMAEPRAVPHIERTRMEGARRQVEERIDRDIEPKLAAAIRSRDGALPGLSLADVFGIEPAPSSSPQASR